MKIDDNNFKITFATPYYISGFGIENRITELARNLPFNFKKQIVCLQQKRPPPRGIDIHSLPKHLHMATAFGPLHFTIWSRIMRSAYFKLFLRNSDIIDAQYFPMTYLPKSSKFIITWHSVTFPEFADDHRLGRLWDNEYFSILRNMRRADMVISVSKWAEKEIKNFDSSIPTSIVPNGVDLNKFRFKPLEKSKKTILCVGRFVPHKGHMEIIKIFNDVVSELKDFDIRLIMVGSMNDKKFFESLTNYAKRMGIKNITYLTNVSDAQMPFVYQLGDIFISCSHWEGFGMPMLEAQACGLPTLGYDICSHSEVVANKNFLSIENDTWTVAENVKRLLTDKVLYEKSSIEARKFAEKFSWNKVAERYMDVIKKL